MCVIIISVLLDYKVFILFALFPCAFHKNADLLPCDRIACIHLLMCLDLAVTRLHVYYCSVYHQLCASSILGFVRQ